MKSEFLMGINDSIIRTPTSERENTFISPLLKNNLLELSIINAFNFYNSFFNINSNILNYKELVNEYNNELEDAKSIMLFSKGGVREKDHLNFWCLSRVLQPKLYVESGVFIGSSLHAFLNTPNINKIIAIDPNIKMLKIDVKNYSFIDLIDKYDFSQIEIENVYNNSLVYFDDHINSAKRIIQAHKKGIKYLLFDDSTGIEGICQRLYPAIPTIPMIMNYKSFNIDDEIIWDWYTEPKKNLTYILKEMLGKNKLNNKRITLKIDRNFIQQCEEAKKLIKKYSKIPDLGVYLAQSTPEKMVDTTKYLIELKL